MLLIKFSIIKIMDSNNVLIKTDKIELVNNIDALDKLYYKLAVLPTPSEIEKYNTLNKTDYQLEKIKEIISETSTALPLFDIVSQNIYLIPASQVFFYVKEEHYRIVTEKILNFLKTALNKATSEKIKHKLEKNIHFLDSYNFDILFNTYLHVIYTNSNQIGKNLTDCRRISFLPYLTNIDSSPYYTRSEIINMALNIKLIKPDNTFYTSDKIDNLCNSVIQNDISNETLIKHQLFIEKNNAQHIIYYYTFYGSLYYNTYLRKSSIYDKYMANNIIKLFSLVKKAPEFPNDVYVYRFINNDNYLEHLNINSIFTEDSFISTSRNPFYESKNHAFGYILLKIKLPKNKEGVGLCVETYSLFSNEQEILLAPGKLKLINIIDSNNDNFTYFHTDINAQKSIRKIYEFEYLDSLDKLEKNLISNNDFNEDQYKIPENFSLISTDPIEKIIEFYRTVPIINEMHYFNWEINNKKYNFQVFYLEKGNSLNEKYYFILKKNPKNKEIIFLVLQDPKTQEINLIIEISDTISVNYLHKYTGTETLEDTELITVISNICYLFNIKYAIIHPRYKKYVNKLNNELVTNLDKLDQYYDEDIILNYSADLIMYNHDVFSYLNKKNKSRFIDNQGVINKINNRLLDRLSRLSPEIVLKLEDPDELYRIYKKHKFTNITNMLIYLQENIFYMVPLFISKLSKVLKTNPFLMGYYLFLIDNYTDNDIIMDIEIQEVDIIQNRS